MMRTTVNLDDALLAQAKRTANEAGLTLGALIEEALRIRLSPVADRSTPLPFDLVVFGGSGFQAGVDPGSIKHLLDDENAERRAPQRRVAEGGGEGGYAAP